MDLIYREGYNYIDKENLKFEESDFTEDELLLLRLAFRLVDTVVETQRTDNYDVNVSNSLYYLKEKLGIYDLVSD